MPELPEVETIKNELLPRLIGRSFTGFTTTWKKMVNYSSVDDFRTALLGRTVTGGSRRGKYFIMNLNDGNNLIAHFKMSGSLLLNPRPEDIERFIRAIFDLDNGDRLYFRDPRKMGRLWLVDDPAQVVGKLGPEPLEPGFTPEVLAGRLKGRSAPIKALLCDQTVIAGVGNMYADEALFSARIHPLRSGDSLSPAEIKRLHGAILQVLRAGIKDKGASEQDYVRPNGDKGTAHFSFLVAHRRGHNCPVCGTPIQRIPIRNRGSYFCPKCQPLKP